MVILIQMIRTFNLSALLLAVFLILSTPTVFSQGLPYGGRVLFVFPCSIGWIVTFIPAGLSPPTLIIPSPILRQTPFLPPRPGSLILGLYSPIPIPFGAFPLPPPLGCFGPFSIIEGGSFL